MVRLAIALSVLAATAGLAACGEEEQSNADYLTEVNQVAQSFSKGVNELSTEISQVDSLEDASGVLDTFAEGTDDLADELDDINPPEAVAELNDRLVALLESLADKAKTAATAINAGDILGGLPTLTKVAGEAAEAGQKIDSTIDQIQQKIGQG